MKQIILGDLHFGIKGFNQKFFSNQMKFFHEQLFPYMLENEIDTIIQLGDFLDNRTTIDIDIFNRIDNELLKFLEKYNFKMITFLGNHDIYYQNSLDTNLMKYFQKLYPNNIKVIQEREFMKFGKYNYLFVPWLTNNEKITQNDMKGADVVFGHFEINNFEMVKGHISHDADFNSQFFQKVPGLKRVISGHYHVQSTDGFVTYIGTPYQLNWGDYKTPRGFFVLDGYNYEFIENIVSQKFIKIKYNDSLEKRLELSGYYNESKFYDNVSELPEIKHHQIKMFINSAKNKEYETVIFELFQLDIKMDIINNVEISELIGADYVGEIKNIGSTELLMSSVNDQYPHLLPLLEEIMYEIKDMEN